MVMSSSPAGGASSSASVNAQDLVPRFESIPVLGPSGFTRMAYTEWGPRESEQTVICVHGLGQGADLLETRVWDALSDRVASYSASRSFRTAAI